MIVYFTTVKRKRPVKEGGDLVKLDWNRKKVLKSVPIFPIEPEILCDPNPRGNSRGGKGIVIRKNKLYVGTYHSVHIYDMDLNLLEIVKNNNFAGVHELDFENKALWVSSTAIDAALKVDLNGNTLSEYWPREDKRLQERLSLVPLDIDKRADNRIRFLDMEMSTQTSHTHLNCVSCSPRGVFILLNRYGMVLRISPEYKLIIQDKRLIGAHSLVFYEKGKMAKICGSFSSSIFTIDIEKGEIISQLDLREYDFVRHLADSHPDQAFSKSIFVRGLEIIKKQMFIGISPAAILSVDLKRKTLNGWFQFSSDVGDAVHGLAVKK